jgi:hypothetical protein
MLRADTVTKPPDLAWAKLLILITATKNRDTTIIYIACAK